MIKKITQVTQVTRAQALQMYPIAVQKVDRLQGATVTYHCLGRGDLGADVDDVPMVWDASIDEWEPM